MSLKSRNFNVFSSLVIIISAVSGTERPIIGIFSHEKPDNTSYIAASYVKAVEASGARVVPIFLGRPPQYYKEIVDKVNGVLFPGGDAAMDPNSGGYFQSAGYVYKYALELNDRNEHFPILGVCQGHEFLSVYSNDFKNDLVNCTNENQVMLPLKFKSNYQESSLFSHASPQIINILTTQNVTANFHDFCVREETLPKVWQVLAFDLDGNGLRFVTAMEMKGVPIVGVQFHPEKNAYEWQKKHPNTHDALVANRHFYDWLVIEARKNNHTYNDETEELGSLIYNYHPVYSGKNNHSVFTQEYVFY